MNRGTPQLTTFTYDTLGRVFTQTKPDGSVSQVAYHVWKDCYLLASAAIEVIVVPAIGRIMQFRKIGDDAGVLWENRELDGQLPKPNSGIWANFGGDKCWPAPQSDWPQIMGHEWPPPAAFDASPFEVSATDWGLILKSPVDPAPMGEQVRSPSRAVSNEGRARWFQNPSSRVSRECAGLLKRDTWVD